MSEFDNWSPKAGGSSEDDINDFLESGGIPSAKFDKIGDTYEGTVIRMEKLQQRDFETGEPQTWDDGSPKNMLHVDIQTDIRDPEIAGDDGIRRLYVRGNMIQAVRSAMRAAQSRIYSGGHLRVTYVRDGDRQSRGRQPAKLYEAVYTPGTRKLTSVSADDLA